MGVTDTKLGHSINSSQKQSKGEREHGVATGEGSKEWSRMKCHNLAQLQIRMLVPKWGRVAEC